MTGTRRRANALRAGDINAAPSNLDDNRAPSAMLDYFAPNPRNPRRSYMALRSLADSLRQHGQLQPVVAISYDAWIRRYPKDAEKLDPTASMVTLIGSSRLHAARLAELETLDYTQRDEFMDPERYPAGPIVAAAVENIHREDMTCLDEARLCQQIAQEIKAQREEAGKVGEVTDAEIAAQFGQHRTWVGQRLGLLRLCQEAQDLIDQHAEGMTFRIARDASRLPADQQMAYIAAQGVGQEDETAVSHIVSETKSETAVSLPKQRRPITRAQALKFLDRYEEEELPVFGALAAETYGTSGFVKLVTGGAEAAGDPALIDAVVTELQAIRVRLATPQD